MAINPVDQRRLRDGARALNLSKPRTRKEMKAALQVLWDGAVALQSVDDLGSPEANQQAWDDMLALQRKAQALERKIKQLKSRRKTDHHKAK